MHMQLSKFDLLAARRRVTKDIRGEFMSQRSTAGPARWETAGLICLRVQGLWASSGPAQGPAMV